MTTHRDRGQSDQFSVHDLSQILDQIVQWSDLQHTIYELLGFCTVSSSGVPTPFAPSAT